MTFKFQDAPPPPAGGGGSKYDHEAVVKELKKNPGKWAVVFQASSVYAQYIKKGKVEAYRPAGTFDAAARTSHTDENGRRVCDIWACYKGE